jgi:hypothetical protein
MVAGFADIGHEIRLVTNWISTQPALRAILAEAGDPGLDFDAWERSLVQGGSERLWPTGTETGRASLIWRLMRHIADADVTGESYPAGGYVLGISEGGDLNDQTRTFAQRVLQPLFDFLSEQVGAESSLLYVLERYVRRIEWFDRDELYEKYTADTRTGEAVYDKDLRKFLFAEGINMPFSQAKSASGLSDVLSELDTDDPLVCEVKLLDGQDRSKRHLASGVNQVVQYAQDYGKNAAYLVVINLSGRSLELPSDGPSDAWPPHLELAGVRVHLIVVRALPPTASASRQGRAAPITISRDDLIDPDAASWEGTGL